MSILHHLLGLSDMLNPDFFPPDLIRGPRANFKSRQEAVSEEVCTNMIMTIAITCSNSKDCTIVVYIMEQFFNARILLLIFLKFVSIFHFLLFSPLFQFYELIFSLFLKTTPPNDDMFFW